MKRLRLWLPVLSVIALLLMPAATVTATGQTPAAQSATGRVDARATGPTDTLPGGMPPLYNGQPYTGKLVYTTAASDESVSAAAITATQITPFYGLTQNFAQLGQPTEQINVPGRVTSANPITALSYTLNSGPSQALSLGGQPDVGITSPSPAPANPRLVNTNDFNVEIPLADLNAGSNQLVLTAQEQGGALTNQTVTVNYQTDTTWPLPYVADWSAVGGVIHDAAHVVDGKWMIDGPHLRVEEVGYDRLVALGDLAWENYEVTVPITVHALDESGFGFPSGGPGVGVMVRWQGHLDDPNYTGLEQPQRGWRRLGALGWYRWGKSNGNIVGAYNLIGGTGQPIGDDISAKELALDTPYNFKLRVDTATSYQACDPDDSANPRRSCYRFKVWEQGTAEPAAWDLVGLGNFGEPSSGSVLLLIHHADVSIGNVTVTPVEPMTDSFNRCELDAGLWAADAPSGASITATGYTADLLAPAGAAHNPAAGGNTVSTVPRIGQLFGNIDFTVQSRFSSTVTSNGQQQGFLLEQDADDFLSVAVRHDGATARLVAEMVAGGTATSKLNLALAAGTPPYLQLTRVGNQWTVAYSFDGFDWTSTTPFTQSLTMSRMSLFGAAAGGTAHTAVVDYVRNPTSSVNPADTQALTFDKVVSAVDPAAVGSISGAPQTPTPGNPTCGTPLEVTATPVDGWEFDRWEGTFGSSEEPVLVRDFSLGEGVTAFFTQGKYTLATTVQNEGSGVGGTITKSPDKSIYLFDETVDLTANVNPGWLFTGWSGDLTGTNPVQSLTMDADKQVTATFTQEHYDLTVSKVDGNGATVTANQVTVTPPADTDGYVFNEIATLTAQADPGWAFGGWSGALSGSANPKQLTLTGDAAVTARFDRLTYQISVNAVTEDNQPTTNGTVTLTPSDGGAGYLYDEVVTLEADPVDGWQFVRWEGDLAGSTNPLSVTVQDHIEATAVFAEIVADTFTVTVNASGQGTVSRTPDQSRYGSGTQVTLTAVPATGWFFDHWEGAVVGATNPISVTVQENIQATAVFTQATPGKFVLAVGAQGQGTVTRNPDQTEFDPNSQVVLTAVPATGWVFDHWEGDLSGSANPLTLTMGQDYVALAIFTEAPQSGTTLYLPWLTSRP